MIAQAELIYKKTIEMKGFRIMASDRKHERFNEYIWITPPAYLAGNKYKPIVYIADKALYEKIEDKIYEHYHLIMLEGSDEDKGSVLEGEIQL